MRFSGYLIIHLVTGYQNIEIQNQSELSSWGAQVLESTTNHLTKRVI